MWWRLCCHTMAIKTWIFFFFFKKGHGFHFPVVEIIHKVACIKVGASENVSGAKLEESYMFSQRMV